MAISDQVKRQQQTMVAVVVIIVVVVAALIVIIATSQPGGNSALAEIDTDSLNNDAGSENNGSNPDATATEETGEGDGNNNTENGEQTNGEDVDPQVAAVEALRNGGIDVEVLFARYAGATRSTTEEGWPALGDPDAAVTIHEYSSFTCGHCANFHNQQFMELLENELAAEEIRWVHVPTLLNQVDVVATASALCANDQGRYWEMHDVMSAWIRLAGIENLSPPFAARALGLDEDEFATCMDSDEILERLEVLASALGVLAEQYNSVTGTPTLTFNGVPPEFGSGGPDIGYIRNKIAELGG